MGDTFFKVKYLLIRWVMRSASGPVKPAKKPFNRIELQIINNLRIGTALSLVYSATRDRAKSGEGLK